MKMIKINNQVINFDHVTGIVEDSGSHGKDCLIYCSNETFNIPCTLSDLIHYLELCNIDFDTIDTKRQRVTVKEKPGQ
jgi:hypothetical protein